MIVDHRDVKGAFKRLSVPIAISMVGGQILGTVDTMAISALGTSALASATAATSAFGVILSGVVGFLGGMSIIAAQRVGAGDMDGFARAARAGLAFVFALAGVAFVLGLTFAHPIMHLMLGTLPNKGGAAWYFIFSCIALFPIAFTSAIITALGAAGNRKFAIRTLIIMNVVHIPLLLILGLGWFTHHPFGIAGAGLSSCISEFAAAGYTIVFLIRHPEYRILSRFDVDWNLAWQSAKLGAPEAVFIVLLLLPDALVVTLLAPLGAVTISALRALNIVNGLTYILPAPLQAATQTVVGQRLGAGDGEGATEFFDRARRLATGFSVLIGAVVAILAWPLAYIFTLNAEVATVAAGPLALYMLALPMRSWALVSIAPIRASGDTRFSMFVGIWCCGLIAPIAWIGVTHFHIGLYSVPVAWMVGWGARLLVTNWKLRRNEWHTQEPILV